MKLLKTIFSVLLMSVVVFAGPGMTWVESYCSICKGGAPATERMQGCCPSAANDKDASSCCCCRNGKTADGAAPVHGDRHCSGHPDGRNRCVSVGNISFDWASSVSHIDLSAVSFVMLPLFFQASAPEPACSSPVFFAGGKSPPIYTPRGYLSFIRVLLI